MNSICVSITPDGTVKYPLHSHTNWEIMYYLSGTGYLATEKENIPFERASIIIVPPETVHGSVSENGFVNISISGDFSHLLMFDRVVKLQDNPSCEGRILAELIFNNRYSNTDYLSTLCSAYIGCLLQNAEYENRINQSVAKIIAEITENFSKSDFNITDCLIKSGYAEDYIRAEFKKITTLTPIQFLTKTRIDHAKKLLEIYGGNITLSDTAEACGFDDPIYFSKRFKQFVGIPPDTYRKSTPKK